MLKPLARTLHDKGLRKKLRSPLMNSKGWRKTEQIGVTLLANTENGKQIHSGTRSLRYFKGSRLYTEEDRDVRTKEERVGALE